VAHDVEIGLDAVRKEHAIDPELKRSSAMDRAAREERTLIGEGTGHASG
jgi:hypothetical protein